MKNTAKFAVAGLVLALTLTAAPQRAAADTGELSSSYETSNPGATQYSPTLIVIVSSILSAIGLL
jgi:hypothetical protein